MKAYTAIVALLATAVMAAPAPVLRRSAVCVSDVSQQAPGCPFSHAARLVEGDWCCVKSLPE
ncbi:hypothetical protein PT974_05045 [Cladobotryum mycophilum]|uniref:Uncharacterized protein n=1 Tax=Cladobotryum mycophilum TaxID=491253 RepID=A0ABR0SS61_9HYPO